MKSSEPEFITIGHILAVWGNKGKIKVKVLTDFPQRFAPSATVFVNQQLTTIESVIWQRGKAIIKLSIVCDVEAAQKLIGQLIEIPLHQLQPLPEGQYYHFQLIGLEVWTTRGELLGSITDILNTASNDNYVVKTPEEEVFIPAIEDVVKSIDLVEGRVVIEPIEGLLNLNKRTDS
jgi:16S rRNA processing protein RimM